MRRSTAVRLGLVLATGAAIVAALSLGVIGPDKAGADSAAPNAQQAAARPPALVQIVAPKVSAGLTGKVGYRAKVTTRRVISRVEFHIDGKLRWTDRSAPYQFKGSKGRWNAGALAAGKHTLLVVAYDRRGRRVGAARKVVRVGAPPPAALPGAGPTPGTPLRRSPSAPGIPSPYAPPEIDGPASVFVSTGGSDSAACSATAPCRSFDRAYRVAQPGQIVEVAGGTYSGQTIPVDPAKTAAAFVIFRPKAGESVRLSNLALYGRYVEARNMAVDDSWYVYDGADNVVIRNLDVKRFFITSASNVYVVGGDIGPIHNGASSIKPRSSSAPKPTNIVIDGAYFHDVTRDEGDHVECLQAWSIEGFTLRNSVFTRCAVFGLFVANLFQGVTNNGLIENNFFDDSTGGGQAVRIAATNLTFRYNSINGSVYVDPAYSSNVNLTANVGNLTGGACQRGVTYEYNVWAGSKCAPTDVNAAPGFLRAVRGDMDLHIGPGSAAVGRGKPGSFPPTDIDGESRPIGAPDAGADER